MPPKTDPEMARSHDQGPKEAAAKHASDHRPSPRARINIAELRRKHRASLSSDAGDSFVVGAEGGGGGSGGQTADSDDTAAGDAGTDRGRARRSSSVMVSRSQLRRSVSARSVATDHTPGVAADASEAAPGTQASSTPSSMQYYQSGALRRAKARSGSNAALPAPAGAGSSPNDAAGGDSTSAAAPAPSLSHFLRQRKKEQKLASVNSVADTNEATWGISPESARRAEAARRLYYGGGGGDDDGD